MRATDMNPLRLSSFGIRGFAGESLTPEVAIDFASAFGTFVDGGRVLIGRDTRLSSDMVHAGVISGLQATGCEVLDLGICPTPMLQFSVSRYQASGAIAISGGHMRMGWNAITLISANGAFLDPLSGEAVLDVFHARDFRKPGWNRIGSVTATDDFSEPYLNALESHLDTASIQHAGLTVVIDAANGAGCRFLPRFAKRLGFRLVAINAEEAGFMARDPEPRPRNARQAASIIPIVKADIGFVTCSDFSRVSLVSEDGETASEEYTFPLVADHVLRRTPGVVVSNCCTTRMVDDIAAIHECRLVKTPVGQAYIMAALADENGMIGGEGNGGVSVPRFSRAVDGLLTMGLILESMAQHPGKISTRLHELPRYHIVKRQVYSEPRHCYRILELIQQHVASWAPDAHLDLTDGLRMDWKDGWLHVRASQTEPMIRIISEARQRDQAESRAMDMVRMLEHEL